MSLRSALTLTLGLSLHRLSPTTARAASTCAHDAVPGALLKFRGLNGTASIQPPDLAQKVVFIVNTASYCGYTPQLTSLQALHERYAARGLVVLGVPSNDFGAQEPDGEAAIAQRYAAAPYGVRFPLAAKYAVSGGEAHPFYLHLQHKLGDAGAPAWNFHKYRFDAQGDLVGVFGPSQDPLEEDVVAAIEDALVARERAPPRTEL